MYGRRKFRPVAPPVARRTFVVALAGTLLGLSASLPAQRLVAPHRIGSLYSYARADAESFLKLLRPELEKLGWVDGQTILLLEPQTVEAKNERLPSMAAELVAQRPDIILAQSVPATLALMKATKSIPIVMIGVGNPVELGIVADFQKPGGNVTGSSVLANEIAGKLLQHLKEADPRLRSVALFNNPTNQHAASFNRKMTADGAALGLHVQVVDIAGEGDLDAAFEAVRRAKAESIMLAAESAVMSNRDVIAGFAHANGLPLVVVGTSASLPATGLLAFGTTRGEYAHLAARYVDRILRGAKPGELSIEGPTRFNLAINLKSAKALGLTIPQSMLQRANEVIQ
jgi:putative ABC transport system substrate-binding protein